MYELLRIDRFITISFANPNEVREGFCIPASASVSRCPLGPSIAALKGFEGTISCDGEDVDEKRASPPARMLGIHIVGLVDVGKTVCVWESAGLVTSWISDRRD
jgi:hypothetical protein